MSPSRNPLARLHHIRDEIDGITAAVAGVSFIEYRASYTLRRAVERGIQVISEAARALPAELLATYPDTPWSSIIGIGNILRHEYQRLDDGQLWEIATVHLPPLSLTVRRMIADLGQ